MALIYDLETMGSAAVSGNFRLLPPCPITIRASTSCVLRVETADFGPQSQATGLSCLFCEGVDLVAHKVCALVETALRTERLDQESWLQCLLARRVQVPI